LATYTVTTSNWNDPAFWSGISETTPDQSLDFSGLPANFTVSFDPASNQLTISDGTTSFVVEDAGGSGTPDATLGGSTLFSFFTNILGGAGNDTLRGSDADDHLDGGGGNDDIYGGSGNDTVIGGDGANLLEGELGDDSLIGNAASGGFTYLRGGAGADTLDGSAGSYDIASYYFSAGGVTIDLSDALAESGSDAQGDVLIGIEQIDGSNTADDFIRVGDSSTLIKGWGGNDTLHGGAAGDRLEGGTGADSLYGHGGNDRFWGGTGADYMEGGDAADTFYFKDGFGADTIVGGELPGTGSDLDTVDFSALTTGITVTYFGDEFGEFTDGIDTGFFSEIESFILTSQSDFLTSGADSVGQLVDAGAGDDTIYAGLGADTLSGGDGADEIYGDAGDDLITGGAGSDDLGGNSGRDTLLGEAGNDYLQGLEDDDFLSGGDGADILIGGTGDDSLSGGDGDDVFVYAAGDGNDTITDFNFGNSGALDDGNTNNNDFVDLSAFYDSIFELRADFDDDGILNQSNATDLGGDPTDYSDNTQFGPDDSLTFQGANQNSFSSDNTGVVCFTTGTLILTPTAEIPVECLRPGDLVMTKDNGPRPIVWSGMRHFDAHDLHHRPHIRPIEIREGAFGNHGALVVSPQHGLLMSHDSDEIMVRAKHLAEMRGGAVRVKNGCRRVTYWHLMFERHEVIFSNGLPSESFFPGPQAMRTLDLGAYGEVTEIFPMLSGVFDKQTARHRYGHTVRSFMRRAELPVEISALQVR
jgi:Ca2+-binding RTX toxin-like protein